MKKLLTTKAMANYAARQANIRKKAYDLIRAYINDKGITDMDAFSDYVYGVTNKYGEAAAALSMQLYDQMAVAQGAKVPYAESADFSILDDIKQQTYAAVNAGLNDDQIANISQNGIKQIAEDTILYNAARDKAEYAWVPQGGSTCAYCMEIASYGWRPASKDMVNGMHADHIHPNCQCEFMIRFSDDYDVEGYNPKSYKRIITGLSGTSMAAKNRALQRQYYAEENGE